jgi:hypothetical protein
VRVLNLPALPDAAVTGENWMKVYRERYRANRISWPRASVLLMAYLAWPNDEERRNSFIASCLALFSEVLANEAPPHSQELAPFGGVAAIAKAAFIPLLGEITHLDRRWLEVAEIFQLIVDMACDDSAILRRGPSISKAIDLCELEKETRGHSQLRQSWSEFRDVAHLLAAAAVLDPYSLVPAKNAEELSILGAIMIAPDIVLALACGLQDFGLSAKSIRREAPILRSDTVWQVPPSHAPENLFVIFRDLTDDQLAFLSSRRAPKKAA